jgi:hypothetical protein
MDSNKTILTIQEIALQVLLEQRQQDPSLTFKLRSKPKGECTIENGYWLPGGKHYVTISFWQGIDVKESANLISFVINDKKESTLRLNSYGSSRVESFFNVVRRSIPSLAQVGQKPVWQLTYEGSFFRRTLEKFIQNEKKTIDNLIRERQPENLGFLDQEAFQEQLDHVLQVRKDEFGLGDGPEQLQAQPAEEEHEQEEPVAS